MKQVSLDALNTHLFETIEMLKNNNDPKASKSERIDIETAKVIANLGKVVVEGYKVKAQVLDIIERGNNTRTISAMAGQQGLIEESSVADRLEQKSY